MTSAIDVIVQEMVTSLLTYSYLDFHQHGFTYLCLHKNRNNSYEKIYFFDGNVASAPEVVSPHNHRYRFRTQLLEGHYINYTFKETDNPAAIPHWKWAYHTPLLGGKGFDPNPTQTFLAPGPITILRPYESKYVPVRPHWMRSQYMCWHTPNEIHTIRVSPGTILHLTQEPDMVKYRKKGVPTHTYTRTPVAPSLQGLYNKPTPSQLIPLLDRLHALMKTYSTPYEVTLQPATIEAVIKELKKL